jgi:competence protein ComEC
MDVDSGEAVLARTPSGKTVLINGGQDPTALSDALGRRLPLLDRRLDLLFVAGVGNTQVAALPENLSRYPPAAVLWAGLPEGSRAARQLYNQLGQSGIPVQEVVPGLTVDLGEGARLNVLSVSKQGAVLLVEWRNFRMLLPFGMDADSLEMAQQNPGLRDISAYLLADQGAAGLNPTPWLRRLNPQLALLSIGADDRRGLPDPEVLAALEGYTLLRTNRDGWIRLITDGERMWVDVEESSAR